MTVRFTVSKADRKGDNMPTPVRILEGGGWKDHTLLDDTTILDKIFDRGKVNTWAWAWDVMPGSTMPGPDLK